MEPEIDQGDYADYPEQRKIIARIKTLKPRTIAVVVVIRHRICAAGLIFGFASQENHDFAVFLLCKCSSIIITLPSRRLFKKIVEIIRRLGNGNNLNKLK